MPSITKFITAAAAAATMASLASAAPSPSKPIYGDVVRVTSEDSLEKRQSVPEGCAFDFGDKFFDFSYRPITGIEGTACVGWDNEPTCGEGSWPDPDFQDIQTAMYDVVQLDGQLSSSDVGNWHGSFEPLTTAFSNRDTTPFNFFFFGLTAPQALTFRWSRDGDYAQVHNTAISPCP